jgi:type II secretory pathway pseudopilin PulG
MRKAFTILELLLSITVLVLFAAAAGVTYSAVEHNTRVAAVNEVARTINHDAVDQAAFQHVAADAPAANSTSVYYTNAFSELGHTTGYTLTYAGPGSYELTNSAWGISVCIQDSSKANVYGTVTPLSGSCCPGGDE